jgi:hypothetical protein
MSARLVLMSAALVLLAACSEKPQQLHAGSSDTQPWSGKPGAYAATGWQGGSQADWDNQIRTRNQRQNEYNRTGLGTPAAAKP